MTSGVVSSSVLSLGVGSGPLSPSSATTALFAICVTPAGTGSFTVNPNTTEVDAPPPDNEPRSMMHTVPAGALSKHDHPIDELATSNDVFAGTVSVMFTLSAT